MAGTATKSRISSQVQDEALFVSNISRLHPKLSPSTTKAEPTTDENPIVDKASVKNEAILNSNENFVKDECLLLNTDVPACIEESIPSNLLYNCHQCNYATNDLQKLNNHLFTHLYKCNLCSYTSFNNTALEVHEEIHFNVVDSNNLNETLFKCNLCNYSNNNLKRLRLHLRKHSELSCNKCDYKCHNKAEMTYHIRRHINGKYMKCEFCEYCSDKLSQLKIHFLNKHLDEEHFSCDMCDYKCRRETALNRHKRRHIKKKSIKPNPHISEIFKKVHQDFIKNKNNFNFL